LPSILMPVDRFTFSRFLAAIFLANATILGMIKIGAV
jgi:hypothetical protein